MPIGELRSIPCKYFWGLSQETKEVIASRVVKDLRENGFPYYNLDREDIARELARLKNGKNEAMLLPGGIIQQSMVGLSVANTFHPEMWSVKCNNHLTPMDVFQSDELLFRAIVKRIGMSDSPLADFNIRKSVKLFSGAQSVSNFRPSVARFIMRGASSVLDPCAGYGGRMVGGFAAGINRYVGVDPAQSTQAGNKKLSEALQVALKDVSPMFYKPISVELPIVPFEDFDTDERFDLAFTSPPYFDIEKYTEEETQSYKRYKTLEAWKDGFLRRLIEKTYFSLLVGGRLAINVPDWLVQDVVSFSAPLFGAPEKIFQMRLSLLPGGKDKKKYSHKLEPILIFVKQ